MSIVTELLNRVGLTNGILHVNVGGATAHFKVVRVKRIRSHEWASLRLQKEFQRSVLLQRATETQARLPLNK